MAAAGYAFLIGDVVDFYNPGTGATVRTKIAQSSATGEVKLDGISDEWLNAQATAQHVKLFHRIKAGDQVDYYSQSSSTWVDAIVTQIRQMSGATEFQINMKSGVWFTSLHKNVRLHSALKVPDSPDLERHAKRLDVGARPTQFELTPGAAAVELDRGLLLHSQEAVRDARPPQLPLGHDPFVDRDPWASAQQNGKGPPAHADDMISKFEEMLGRGLAAQTKLINEQSSTINSNIVGMEQRLGQRLDAHDALHEEHKAKFVRQDKEIDALTSKMAGIEAMITSKMKGLSLTAQSKHQMEKEAFLGGFPHLPKPALKAKAEQFIGKRSDS